MRSAFSADGPSGNQQEHEEVAGPLRELVDGADNGQIAPGWRRLWRRRDTGHYSGHQLTLRRSPIVNPVKNWPHHPVRPQSPSSGPVECYFSGDLGASGWIAVAAASRSADPAALPPLVEGRVWSSEAPIVWMRLPNGAVMARSLTRRATVQLLMNVCLWRWAQLVSATL